MATVRRVKIAKADVLKALRENRAKRLALLEKKSTEEAKDLIEKLIRSRDQAIRALKDVRAGKFSENRRYVDSVYIDPPSKPDVSKYDRAIKMFELEKADPVTLTEIEIGKFIHDTERWV